MRREGRGGMRGEMEIYSVADGEEEREFED